MKKAIQVLLLFSVLFLSMCHSKNGKLTDTNATQRDENENVKINEQQKPTLMVLPSDALLQRLGCLKSISNQGITSHQRDYQKAFVKDSELKFVISEIQSQFINVGFPLEDLEQSLKSINNELAVDNVSNIQKDSKTLLLNTVRPDIILEIDYVSVLDGSSRNLKTSLTYSFKAIDSYSNKTIASIQNTRVPNSDGIANAMKDEIDKNITIMTGQITNSFADIIQNGREISLRIAVSIDANVKLTESLSKDNTIDNYIYDWLKNNTFGGSFKRDRATDLELRYKNIRIKTLDKNGQPYTAYDFTKNLINALEGKYSLNCKNNTQSLTDALIIIEGK